MQLSDLQGLTPGELIDKIKAAKGATSTESYLDQLDPEKHTVVADTATIKDKIKKTDTGIETVKANRLPIPIQSQIVLYASMFLCGNPIEVSGQPTEGKEQDMFDSLAKVLKDTKVDFRDVDLAAKWMGETESAELWYITDVESDDPYWAGSPMDGAQYKLKMRVLAPSLGDSLYPVFDRSGDMIAFGRGYKIKENDEEIEHFDFYTADEIVYYTDIDGAFIEDPETPKVANTIKKIPIIYHKRDKPEWADVQRLIERLEVLTSKHADNNDYFGDPILLLLGEVEGWAEKGEAGKTVRLKSTREQQADARYLTWDNSPESKKLEIERLERLVNDMTQTPPISFENMKGLGDLSGIALKMLFLSAHMKAAKNAAVFGEGIQRRYNFIMAALAVFKQDMTKGLTLNVRPKFKYFLPSNDTEVLNNIATAIAAGIQSKETGTEQNPLIEDPETEKERIKAESATTLNDIGNEDN